MTGTAKLGLCAALCALALPAAARAGDHSTRSDRHVLLISVDGLHSSDLDRWLASDPAGSALVSLAHRGTTFSHAKSSFPSDSFPGILAIATGGTPKSTGVFYDNSYDRSLYPPGDADCSGPAGTQVLYDESIDYDTAQLDGGASAHGGQAIDPAKLPRAKTDHGCVPVHPNEFLRTNTIFGVIHDAGLRTAWADKHPAYQLLNGPDPHAIDDLYTPEINSDAPGGDYTSSESNVQTYDGIKVQAVLNEIAGRPSTCSGPCPTVGVPAILGMNFQAVSVAQKLPNPGSPLDPDGRPFIGGYAPDGSFNPNLSSAMQFVDASLAKMIDGLRQAGLLDSTEIIVTAKHGQSPIDPQTLRRVSPDWLPGVVASSTGATFPDPASTFDQQASVTEDDVGLVWLSSPFQAKTPDLLAALEQPDNRQAGDIARVISGRRLRALFGDPTTDPRVPDAVVQPRDGGLYSFSKKKVAEHGGGANDDRHVALLVAGPGGGERQTNDEPVTTTQVAPTILSFLGIGSRRLDAVRREGTEALPDQAGGD